MNKPSVERVRATGSGRTYGERSDAELAQALAEGHGWAAGEAWHRMSPMVLSLTERYLGSKSEAEDVTQEVFHRLFRKAGKLRDPDRLRSFVYRCAMNALRMELRRRRRGAWITLEEPEFIAELRSVTPDPETRDLLERFALLLSRLEPRERRTFLSKRIDAMTLDEISAELNMPVSTVKRKINRASSKLNRWVNADPELVHLLTAVVERSPASQ